MDYPYFLIVCALMTLLAVVLLLCPIKYRRSLLISSLLSTPFSLASFLFDPEYWHPERLFGGRIGIEDLLFSFATGGLVWLFAIWPVHRRISLNLEFKKILKRNIVFVVPACMLYLVLWHVGVGVMTATLISAGLYAPFILFFKPLLKPVFLAGIAGFTIFYLIFIKASFLFFSDIITLWNPGRLWGILFWGIPVEEIAWAVVFGGTWPVVMAYFFDLTFLYDRRRSSSQVMKISD